MIFLLFLDKKTVLFIESTFSDNTKSWVKIYYKYAYEEKFFARSQNYVHFFLEENSIESTIIPF